jgi:hypothetical protein
MGIYRYAAWGVVFGLAFMLVGGLVLWAYGARRMTGLVEVTGPEAAATRLFHTKLIRWFFVYGVCMTTLGMAILLWAGSILYF